MGWVDRNWAIPSRAWDLEVEAMASSKSKMKESQASEVRTLARALELLPGTYIVDRRGRTFEARRCAARCISSLCVG